MAPPSNSLLLLYEESSDSQQQWRYRDYQPLYRKCQLRLTGATEAALDKRTYVVLLECYVGDGLVSGGAVMQWVLCAFTAPSISSVVVSSIRKRCTQPLGLCL